MKNLLLLGTIAALALTTTVQAQSQEQMRYNREATVRHSANAERTTVAPLTNRSVVRNSSTNRSVVRNYRTGGRYYANGTRYYRGGRYYGRYYNNSGPFVSVGVGGYYPYDYGYGYGYPYAYGYGGYPYNYGYGYVGAYPSDYYADQYPTGYTTTTYRTSRNGDLAYDDNVVAAVQQRLKQKGYYLGAVDAVAGPETRSAVARWEGNHGMNPDGRIDESTLRSLGIS